MEKIPEFYAVIKDTVEFDKWFSIRPYPDGFNYNDTVLPEGLLTFITLEPGEACGRYYYGRTPPVIGLAEMLRLEELTQGELIGYVSPVRMFIHEFNKQHPEYTLYVPALPTKESKAYVQRVPSSTTKENKSMTQDTNYDNYYAAIVDTSKFIEAYGAWGIGDPVNLSDAGVQFIHTRKAEDMNRLRGLPALKVTEIASVFFAESHGSGSVNNFFGELFSDYAPGKSIVFSGKEQGKMTPDIVNSADLKIYDLATGTYKTLAEVSKYVPAPTVVPGVIKMVRRVMALRALVALNIAYPATRGESISLPFTHDDGTIDLLALVKYSSTQQERFKASLKQPEHQKVSLSEAKVFLDSEAGKTPVCEHCSHALTEEEIAEVTDRMTAALWGNMRPMHHVDVSKGKVEYRNLLGNVVSSRPYFIDYSPMFEFIQKLYAEDVKDEMPKDTNGNTPDIKIHTGSVFHRQNIFNRYFNAGNVLSKVLPVGMSETLATCDDIKLETAQPSTGFASTLVKSRHEEKTIEALERINVYLERIWKELEKSNPGKVVINTELNMPGPVKEEMVPETVPDLPLPVYAERTDQNPATLLVVGYHFKGGKTYHIENNWGFPRDEVDGIEFCNCEPVYGFETPTAMARHLNQLNAEAQTGWVFKPASELLSGLARELLVDPDAFKSGSKCFLMKRSVEAFNETFGYNPDNRANNVGAVDMAVVVFGDALNDSLK